MNELYMSNTETVPFVSVIIPVLNDTDRLLICLKALENQTYPHDFYEIIVVDNGSSANLEKTLRPLLNVRYVAEPILGSYTARNSGIKLAEGDVLAFTDSDCIPAPNWLESGQRALSTAKNCGLVGGEIIFSFRSAHSPGAFEIYDRLTYLRQAYYIKNLKFSTTANMFTFKKIFEDVGFFNAKLKSSGDRDWGNRVYHAGYTLCYCSDAKVIHPARYSFKQVYRKTVRVVDGVFDIQSEHLSSRQQLLSLLKHATLPPIKRIIALKVSLEAEGAYTKLKVAGIMLLFKYIWFIRMIRNIRKAAMENSKNRPLGF